MTDKSAFATIAGVALVVAAVAQAPASATKLMPYEQRDGQREARADVRAHRPTKLYSAVFNGRAPGFQTPGLVYCDPRYAYPDGNLRLFAPLPEADWGEPGPFPPHYQAAISFARNYNLVMFKARKAEIMRVCPKVQLRN